MKAMVLAAGLGRRLASVSDGLPKCLVDVGGKPMIYHVISHLSTSASVDYIVFNLHYKREFLKDALITISKDFKDIEFHFSEEVQLLDTGGGLKLANKHFKDCKSFILHNSDVFSEINLKEVVRYHEDSSALATLVANDRPSTRPLYFNSGGQLLGSSIEFSTEKLPPDAKPLGFCGISCLSPQIFSCMPEESIFSIITTFVNASKSGHRIQAFTTHEYWIDMGSPDKLESLRNKVLLCK